MGSESDLALRVNRLGARLLRTQISSLVLIGIMAVLLLSRTRAGRAIEATKFVLTDQSGQIFASLSHEDSETCLQLRAQKPSNAHLCVGDDYGSSLFLSNHEGADRAFLSPGTQDLDPGLVISQGDGKNLIAGSLGQSVRFMVGHATEENSLLLTVEGEHPTVSVLGASRKPIWQSPRTPASQR